MKLAITKGLASSLLALSLAVTLASCATDAPPPPPPPAPAPAPAGPPVALATEISDAAAVYVDYIQKASAIKNQFADGADIQAKLASAEAYEPNQLANGAVAFAAIVAMQEPAFRASLRNYATDNAVRADMVNRLLSDPAYVAVLPGADAAARRVILALSSDGQLVFKAGAAVKQSAYDIQMQKWSREFVIDREGRLAKAKSSAVTLASVQSDASAQLLTAALTGSGLVTRATTGQSTGSYAVGGAGDGVTFTPGTGQPAQPQATVSTPIASDAATTSAAANQPQTVFDRPDLFNQPYTQAVNRALTIAAIAILGEGGSTRAPALTSLLNDGEGQKCLAMSKLNLYQCLAVAKPHYEDVFCLGQHVLMDTGQCLGEMSSNALSFEPVKRVGFKADGTSAYTDPKPYLKPAPVKKASGKKKATTSKKK
ncbi:hypothetical protein [Asticcacaulis sp. 201]|uniref:hypothetical protein n=1 Tax=Asticcacaulis sp. 201 TaxID=3028787 RepID=UPI002915F049|nr:hypothetical protein [Asticcacaulis sp. 201]MDV6329753.1 hypothetical protein [Asticcacaulis sp. 201]